MSVVEIPKEALVRKKKDNKKNNQIRTPSKVLVDDAIVFQNAGTSLSGNKETPKPQQQQHHQQQPQQPQQQSLVDDAIIFAKPASENNNNVNNNNSNNSNNARPSRSSESPKVSKRKISGKNHKAKGKDQVEETWMDDVAQIKESQDFDFATNLALFDKASVFKDLKSKDKVSFANRLAGHNKVDSPVKKVNYDNNEMVLNDKDDLWDNISAVGESPVATTTTSPTNEYEKVTEEVKKLNFDDKGKPETTKKTKISILKRPETTVKKEEQEKKSASRQAILSPTINHFASEVKFVLPGIDSPLALSSPLQLLEIERLSIDNYGFSGQLFAENASFGLSKLIIKTLGGAGRIANNNHNKPPLVLILVGNNRAGARALAAGRQLTNRGVRVIAFVLSSEVSDIINGDANGNGAKNGDSDDKEVFYDAEEEFDNNVKDQLRLFIAYGGKVFNKFQALENSLNALDSPLELVVDALQGYDTNLTDLWGDELQTCLRLIKWVNVKLATKVKIVSIDIASGLDGGSGRFALSASDIEQVKSAASSVEPVDNGKSGDVVNDDDDDNSQVGPDDLRIRSNVIVSLGLPVIGVLHAYHLGVTELGDWTHYLIDIGIPNKVYGSRGSLRKFNKNYFAGDDWFKEITVSRP